ncbi:MAG: hypothetical protein ACOCYZ_06410 [Halococcoides sp.]
MSVAEDPTDGDGADDGTLTRDEREVFEELREATTDADVRELCALILQSREETNS